MKTDQLKSQIATDLILEGIHTGRFASGQRLPSERALAVELGMNHLTVRRGLAVLAQRGIIEKRPKVGNFIAAHPTALPVIVALPWWVLGGKTVLPHFASIVSGIHTALDQNEFAVSMLSYRRSHLWHDVGNIAVERSVRGVILMSGTDVQPTDVKPLLDRRIAVVDLTARAALQSLNLPSVRIDTTTILAASLDQLTAMGHRRIMVAEYTANSQRRSHLRTIGRACHTYRLGKLRHVVVDVTNPTAKPDFTELSAVFAKRPRPTAVIVPDEQAAAAVFRMCYRLNIQVPADLSIVAISDCQPDQHPVPLAAPDTPQLAVQQGRTAAQLLVSIMRGHTPDQRQVVLKSDIQWKASASPYTPASLAKQPSS